MIRGIAIMGLNGAGKSTLAHALAKQCGFFEMDVEDYYFPQQREGRRCALENRVCGPGGEEIPFAKSETKEDVQAAMLADMERHPRFVLSGVTMDWCEAITARIDMAFIVHTPREERLNRIQSREEKRFGARVLEGGDMFEQQAKFREMARSRDLRTVEESARKLGCPVVMLDGTKSIEENLLAVMEYLNQ